MKVHLVNPSDMSFGTAVITPRWLYVLAAATPVAFGDVEICDETLERLDPLRIAAGDIVGVGIHTGNAFRAYEVGRMARERGAWVVFGGIHATLYPEEVLEFGAAHCAVKGSSAPVHTRTGAELADCEGQLTIITGCCSSSTNGVPSPYWSIALPADTRSRAKLPAKTSGELAVGRLIV